MFYSCSPCEQLFRCWVGGRRTASDGVGSCDRTAMRTNLEADRLGRARNPGSRPMDAEVRAVEEERPAAAPGSAARASPRSIAASPVRAGWGPLRKLLAFAGPGYLVAVGYMDPGNWATDLAGGSAFGYTLLSVVLMSNLMAILLQTLAPQARASSPAATSPRPAATTIRRPVEHRAVGAVRDRHRRLRPGRGDRLGHRAATCCSASRCCVGVLLTGARRAADPAPAAARHPQARGVHHQL